MIIVLIVIVGEIAIGAWCAYENDRDVRARRSDRL